MVKCIAACLGPPSESQTDVHARYYAILSRTTARPGFHTPGRERSRAEDKDAKRELRRERLDSPPRMRLLRIPVPSSTSAGRTQATARPPSRDYLDANWTARGKSAKPAAWGDVPDLLGERELLQTNVQRVLKRVRVIGDDGTRVDDSPALGLHTSRIRLAVAAQRSTALSVVWADYMINPFLTRRFESLRQQLTGSHRVVFLFHGTALRNIPRIEEQGFLGAMTACSSVARVYFSKNVSYAYDFTCAKLNAAEAPHHRFDSTEERSGRLFLTALLVADGPSETSENGAQADQIVMRTDAACLPLYVLQMKMTNRLLTA